MPDSSKAMPTAVAPRLYWPQLDGLRFLAALAVFVNHAPQVVGIPPVFKDIGWAGVDLFLVLSAYLLTRLLREEINNTGEVRLGKYFTRRILRIWPLHWGYVIAVLVIVVATGRFETAQFGNWLSHITFVNNWTLTRTGYSANLPFTAHLWTISLEEQFYLIIPFVVLVMIKQPPRHLAKLLLGCLAFLVLARAACVIMGTENGEQAFIWTLPLRSDAFLLGAALALGAFDGLAAKINGDAAFALGAIALLTTNFIGSPYSSTWSTPFLYTVVDAACLLMVLGCLQGTWVRRALAVNPLRYFGKISFGIYVYHLVALRISPAILKRLRFDDDGWSNLLLALTITIVMAILSYELYEKKFLKLKHRFEMVDSRPA